MGDSSLDDGAPSLEARLVRAELARELFGAESQPVALGRYRVVRRLGAGGMGRVFEAYDEDNGERLAIKLLRKQDEQTQRRLKREFRTVAELHHRNLVQFL